nr:WPP domain-interacting tail-anchored protein 1-like [Tanacetum cinerariifolium]
MNRGVSSGGGQSPLNYLFWGGEAPKPALKATQAAPCETHAANNVSATKSYLFVMVTTASYDASSRTSSLYSSGASSISIKTSRDSESTGEIIARFELDITFICERLTNLNLLSMHVETKESDFEPFVSDMDPDLVFKVLEYDLLAGVFGSEVRLLETHNAETTLENFYEAYYSSELLMESSNELLSRIKMLHFNLKGSVHREVEFKSNLLKLQLANEKTRTQVEVKKENTAQELKDSNEKVVSLEKQLSDTNVKLQNAKAYYEASLEDKSMLQFTIKDMENVIEDLKSKVTRAEGQTDSVEDKCIILSKANDDLKKELSFVTSRVRCLETSLHQMEEAKKASAKDISIRSNFITNLVMQMAHQRERMQKQIASLKHENKILVKSLRKRDEGHAEILSHGDKANNDFSTDNKEALSSNSE